MTSELRESLQAVLAETYDLHRELAGGGMSRLFLATDRALRRPVVIKVLPPERTSTVSAMRFQREIELAAQLQHPHILPIHAAGARDGILYYVMPYVPGESLRHRLLREPRLPLTDALRVLREAADALAYAHHLGVIHRDVKPENILLTQGHALLADFGIARALAPVQERSGSDSRLTDSGVAMGTPGYMSPEQLAGERKVDGRSDVYALGVIGFEMLAGEPPFRGSSAQAIITAHLTLPPPDLRRIRPDVPPAVAAAIQRALQKDPPARFRNAGELRDALDEAGTLTSAVPVVQPPRWWRRLVAPLRNLHRATTAAAAPDRGQRPSSSVIAVLPFTVRGSGRLSYLGDGMVDLLSTRLSGAGDLTTADPRAVLSIVDQQAARGLDPTRARRIAERLGAGRFVLGSLLEVGGRLQVTAALYSSGANADASATASADDEGEVFDVVDSVAIQLLSSLSAEARSGFGRLSTRTTASLSALKAYLQGERHLRQGRYTLARESLHRAVDEDPGFSLAWYRLSVAAEWLTDRDLQDHAAEQALRHSDRLAERERQMLQAFVAWRRGSKRAESLYRAIIGTHPNDVEAWIQLGEVLFHYGPLCGRSIVTSREAWERVLSFEPDHLGALYHLSRIASVEGQRGELMTLTERVLTLSPQSERALEARALRAFSLDDSEEQERVLTELRSVSDSTALGIMRVVATCSDNLGGAARLGRAVVAASHSSEARTLAHVSLAYVEAARGCWNGARAELDAAAALDPIWSLEARAHLATMPFSPWTADYDDLVERLARWPAADHPPRTHPSLFVRAHNDLFQHLRAYLLAVLSIRLGDSTAAGRYAAELATLPGSPANRALAHALGEHVRAEIAFGGGDAKLALETIVRAEVEVGYDCGITSPFYSGAGARFLRAAAAEATGCAADAAQWFGSFGEMSIYDLVYLVPGLVRRANALEQLGQPVDAVATYRRALTLWSARDPAMDAIVRPAAERLAALGFGASPARPSVSPAGFHSSPDAPIGA